MGVPVAGIVVRGTALPTTRFLARWLFAAGCGAVAAAACPVEDVGAADAVGRLEVICVSDNKSPVNRMF